jgi:hypothetical protein
MEQEGFSMSLTQTSTIRLKVEVCLGKNGGGRRVQD